MEVSDTKVGGIGRWSKALLASFDQGKLGGLEAKQAIALFGNIDLLVNNAGISQRSLAIDTPFEDDLKILETDLIGTIALTKAMLPHLLERKGQIVVISSVMGKINTKYRSTYAAAKHGVVGFFESLRLEVEDLGLMYAIFYLDSSLPTLPGMQSELPKRYSKTAAMPRECKQLYLPKKHSRPSISGKKTFTSVG